MVSKLDARKNKLGWFIYIRKLCNNKVGIKNVPSYNTAHTIPNYITQAMKNLNIECPPLKHPFLGW